MLNNLKKNNKRKSIVAAEMTFVTVVTIVVLVSNMATTPVAALLSSTRQAGYTVLDPEVPSVVSGDNIYIAWWTNNTENGNEEVMFRASIDGGATFGERINLSNSPDTQSQTAEILAEGDSVFVSWWELNENVHPHTNESVLRVSNDGG
jgi:hypothetical protein